MEREKRLITDGSPCDVNYFNRHLLTMYQVLEIGENPCPNYSICKAKPIHCALIYGLEVAKNVINKSTLEKELKDFSRADFLNNPFWDSMNRREFYTNKGKAKFIDAVERFARTVLLMNLSESVFEHCDKCKGVKLEKTVYDSIHDGTSPLSGRGRTQSRDVQYCPDCEPEPQGGFLNEDPRDAEDLEMIRKFRKQNE